MREALRPTGTLSGPPRIRTGPASSPGIRYPLTPPRNGPGADRRRTVRPAVWYAVAALVTAAVFGPYTAQVGVRTEQVAVYALLLVALLAGRIQLTAVAALVLLLLVTEFLVAVVGGSAPTGAPVAVESGSLLAGIDSLLMPIAVLTLTLLMASSGADPRRLLRIVCTVLVVAMCLNTVLSCVSIRYDITPLLGAFWENHSGQESVAVRAAQLGRLSGIFNQPAEAGALYSLALLAAVHRYRDRTVPFVVATALLTIGGVLTVSKIFLLIGLPLGLWQVVRSFGIARPRVWALTSAVLCTMLAAQYGLLPPWAGADYLTRLLRPPGDGTDLVGFYTAGRLGDTPTLQYVSDAVLGSSPWFGLGAGGLAAAYDNGWIEALAVAGIVGVLLYTGILGCLVAAWFLRRPGTDPATVRFASGLVVVVLGGSLGLPMLTANRVGTITWLLIGLLLLVPAPRAPVRVPGR
ncbi:hypothetical protein [Plantactinospora endophytica]|uniref:O-antigen ligase domain-containing protein n=1 Tax=Plantactinospora endophytica TaxID=673535 RepID=A0ABQ4EAC8_9ACTN|nr:hypothetical protein [Plantactinospora endophytica]GIG91683.1 hypothetical protein Pen02_66190 [Plantactinospora endophytica]